MIVRMGLITRKPDLAEAEFVRRWREGHGPLVRKLLPELGGYLQNLIVDRSQRAIEYKRGSVEVDGISQLFFADLSAMRRSIDARALGALADDEKNFVGDLILLTALQNTVVAPPTQGPFVKRMSFLRKRAEISFQEFQNQWFDMHGMLVKRLPGLLGYRQNLVIDRRKNRFDDNDDVRIPIDGVVELWFEDSAAIDHAFRSPRGKTTMMHAEEFIAEISTYMVQTTAIVPELAA